MPTNHRHRRTKYLVDHRMQLGTAFTLGGLIVAGLVLYGLASMLTTSEFAETSSSQLTQVALIANGAYLLLVLGANALVVIVLTHRIAGPAQVLERAVRGMLQGEFDHRVALRKKDHLQDLAAAVSQLQDELRRREESRDELLAAIRTHLRGGDLVSAERLLGPGERATGKPFSGEASDAPRVEDLAVAREP